jgi:hypothetical protein
MEQRIRIGVKNEADGTKTWLVYWPPQLVQGGEYDIYFSMWNDYKRGEHSWRRLRDVAAEHAASAALHLPSDRDGILGEILPKNNRTKNTQHQTKTNKMDRPSQRRGACKKFGLKSRCLYNSHLTLKKL